MNTLSLESAASKNWDLIVIGAGVAGAGFAIQTARLGMKTLLVEAKSFPRDKVCGGCLNQRSQAALRRLNVWPELLKCGFQSIRHVDLRVGKTRGSWAIPELYCVSRRTLDEVLVRAAIRAGADFLSETRAFLVNDSDVQTSDAVTVDLQSHNQTCA